MAGTAPILTDKHRLALAAAIKDGPIPAIHGVVRWRVVDLCQWLWDGYALVISKQTLSRELRKMGVAAKGSVLRGRMEWQRRV